MEEEKRIKVLLQDFKSYEPKLNTRYEFVNILTGNDVPPAYIVQILLLGIMQFKNYGRMEKVQWHTYVKYKNHLFMIRDYKFGTWSIEGLETNGEDFQLAKEIQNKIRNASKIADKILYNALTPKIKKGQFYLNNVYYKLFSLYTFYEKQVLDTLKKYEEFEKKYQKEKKKQEFSKISNTALRYEKTISKYSFALILAFFSFFEFLLDSIFAFEQPNKNFFNFRREKWKERFKLLFPIDKNKKIKLLYDELIRIKEDYRNPLTHGLTNEINLLFPLPSVGLIPISYEYLSCKTYYGIVEIEKEDALKIISTFRRFLKFLEKNTPYKFYVLYLNYGFPIPINISEISEIKNKMTDYKEFRKYLEEKAAYEDMFTNREI